MKETPLSPRIQMPLSSRNTEFEDRVKFDIPDEGPDEIKFMTPIELTEELSPAGLNQKQIKN